MPAYKIELISFKIFLKINTSYIDPIMNENKATIKVAEKENIPFIDLSFLLKKDSKYYWDFIHYSNEGNKKIGEILAPKIRNIIDKNLIN